MYLLVCRAGDATYHDVMSTRFPLAGAWRIQPSMH